MAESVVFDFACELLERETSLDRLEARGTVRIALKQAGLEARGVSRQQMTVVAQKLLPGELSGRGIADADRVCSELTAGLERLVDEPAQETAADVFQRLGG
jgi:hypothetical protein